MQPRLILIDIPQPVPPESGQVVTVRIRAYSHKHRPHIIWKYLPRFHSLKARGLFSRFRAWTTTRPCTKSPQPRYARLILHPIFPKITTISTAPEHSEAYSYDTLMFDTNSIGVVFTARSRAYSYNRVKGGAINYHSLRNQGLFSHFLLHGAFLYMSCLHSLN